MSGCGFGTTETNLKMPKMANNVLKLFYQNVRGLRTKTQTFNNNLAASNYDIVAITETGLNSSMHDGELIPPGFNVLRCDRMDGRKQGGVLLAVRSRFQLARLPADNVDTALFELVCATVNSRNNNCLFLCCVVYIPPKCDAEQYMHLFRILENICIKYEKVVVIGDFNMPSATLEFQIAALCCIYIWSVESAVLDPSLYLSPSPPLTDVSGSLTPGELWTRPVERMARNTGDTVPSVTEEKPVSKRKPQPMEKAKFFWPSLRSAHYSVDTGNVQVPLTFSVSGLYGRYSPGTVGSSGVIGSSYGTITDIGAPISSGLAGTSYGKYRTYSGLRIYGGENGPAWSGWGNGKWGHYGKG